MSLVFFCIFPFSLSHATSLSVRPFSEFTLNAPIIVHGVTHHIRTENGLTHDGGKTIYTYADLEIKEVIKGDVSREGIVLRKLGGTKDGVTLEIPSSVQFNEDEDSVFYLRRTSEDRTYEVAGMEMGKFGVKEENGEQTLTGGIFSLSHPDMSPEIVKENLHPWKINQLKQLVQSQNSTNTTAAQTQPAAKSLTDNQKVTAEKTEAGAPQQDTTATTPGTSSSSRAWVVALLVLLIAGLTIVRRRKS